MTDQGLFARSISSFLFIYSRPLLEGYEQNFPMNYILHLNKTFIRLILYPNPVTNMTLIISFITFFVIDVIGEYFKFPKLRLGTWTHGHLSFWNGRRKLTFNGQRKQDIFH